MIGGGDGHLCRFLSVDKTSSTPVSYTHLTLPTTTPV